MGKAGISIIKRASFLPYSQPFIDDDEINEVVETLKSGWLTMGSKTLHFEELLADYIGVKYAVAVNSCTAALHLCLLALGIGQGDEVITTPYTFAATANVIVQVGAKPVFVDIDPKTFNIDPEKIKQAVTSKTKAIIPVHYAGQPCDLRAIQEIANDKKLRIIEDAAHALGAEYEKKKIGATENLTCFSFYPTKTITTGEGGAITTNNKEIADKTRLLRLHGMSHDAWRRYANVGSWYYEIEECGYKYNFTDLQAAIGIHQLKKIGKFLEVRKIYAEIYNRELGKIKGVTVPFLKGNIKHPYHIYPILLENHNRNNFIESLREMNIGCSVHFIPLHLHPFYRRMFSYQKGDFPIAEWVYEREVSLPLYPKMSNEDVDYVVSAVKTVLSD